MILPNNIEAEQAILGAIFINPDKSMLSIAQKLSAESFYQPKHRIIFSAMSELFAENKSADIISVANRLTEDRSIERAGGRQYLNELLDLATTDSSIDYYADIVKEKWIRREAYLSAIELADNACKESVDISSVQSQTENLSTIFSRREAGSIKKISEYIPATLKRIESVVQSGFAGIPSGLKAIDKHLRGFRPEVYIIAGRPGLGKTALSLDIAVRQSQMKHPDDPSRNIRVGYVSIEMEGGALTERLITREMRRPCDIVPFGMKEIDHMREVITAASEVNTYGIYLDDRPHIHVQDAISSAHEMILRHSIDIIYFDYLQLLGSAEDSGSREQELSSVMRHMTRLRKRFKIPVITVAQLNRRCEERADKRPIMSDLRESGSLEQDSAGVMLVHNPEYWGMEGSHEVIFAKNRYGPPGIGYLYWDKRSYRFEDITLEKQPR